MKIKELSHSIDVNQMELAKKLNVSQKTISNYLNGVTEPPASVLCKLADYFNVSLDYLCDRQWNNQVGYIPEEKKEVVKIILLLNEANTLKLFGYASGLLANQN